VTSQSGGAILKLENQVAIVTGAGSGIGRAIALRFAEEGADIVIVYSRNDANAQESARMIEALGRRALVCKADVSDGPAVTEVTDQAINTLGRIDCLVNNAGIYMSASLFDTTEELWDRVLDVDLKSVYLCTQAVARYWRKAERGGKVINIGSVHGIRSWRGLAAYAAAKTGMISLTRTMALELAPYDTNVNLVSAGAIAVGGNLERTSDAEFMARVKREIPLARMGEGQEVANLVLFLASDESDYITGADMVIDGGLVLHPFSV
jgi:NAD(P)-dependent dehydrogenase (short-subunit alcohol dehydrogenase family)